MSRKSPLDIVEETPAVVGTGLVALDVVINNNVRQPPRLWAGGTCGNVLTILSYLGWHAYPVGRLDEDIASKHLMRDLSRWGVHLKFIHPRPGGNTPVIVQQIRHNSAGKAFHKFLWNCPNCGTSLPRYKAVLASDAHAIAAQIENPKVFFLDRVSRGALILAEASAAKGAIVVFEPSGVGEPRLFHEALALAHVLKYSRERMGYLSEVESTVDTLLEIETLGEEGLRYRSKLPSCQSKDWERLDAYTVDHVKDTAGAGDWCTAGIIQALGQKGLQGLKRVTPAQLLEAFRFGQALAAWNCRFEGARGGMYSVSKKSFRCELEQIMRGNGHKRSIPDDTHEMVKAIFGDICPKCADKMVE